MTKRISSIQNPSLVQNAFLIGAIGIFLGSVPSLAIAKEAQTAAKAKAKSAAKSKGKASIRKPASSTRPPATAARKPATVAKKSVSAEQRESRLQHAQELLGKYYPHSVAKAGEGVLKINSLIYQWTKERLPKAYRSKYKQVAQTIIDESLRYGFDPVFLMSVIQRESRFNPATIGGVGEIGLMQIRPTTGKWIAQKFNMPWKGDKSLLDPVMNIRLGSAYLNYLRDRFDSHAQLYLAAYNMGQNNVSNILERNIWPKDYPRHVMRNYVDFYSTIKDSNAKRTRI